ncbi:biotin--[acetyl-CoA-carboxylase] ligase [Peptostreptococcus russellii]|uniref:biotin--[acetyl-CoA-carboxylase] ligase n=1 Tax=Peptostreptococcus russellii TaxID=215200 RepID=UPI003F5894FB
MDKNEKNIEERTSFNKKTSKEQVLDILIENMDIHISGESISQQLGISRASVWKHINSLKKEGFEIESKSGIGYILLGKTDSSLTSYEIKRGLETEFIGQNIEYFKSIDSTNTFAKNIAPKSDEGMVIISDEQSSGKGRVGREWISKENEGIYFSIILKPDIDIMNASFLTQVAGAAMVSSLEKMGVESTIKWPNDIIVNGKKISGILTEMSAEIDQISYIVVGIGVNLYNQSFEEEIESKATSLKKEGYDIDKKEFLQRFFLEFEDLYKEFLSGDKESTISILRKKSAVLDKEVYIIDRTGKTKVYARDIDENGNLLVEKENGSIETIFTGEISIRGLESYI